MVDYVADSHELAQRIRRLMFAEGTDAELAEKLQRVPGVDAELLTQGAELVYAYRDTLDDAGKRLLGELWTYANEQGWSTMVGGAKGSDNRAEQIIRDVRRDLGELKSAVDPEAAPEPRLELRAGFDWRKPGDAPEGAPAAPER